MEKQRSGGEYGSRMAKSEKHVVVCTTTLRADAILDFLNEFYAHPMLQVEGELLLIWSTVMISGDLLGFLCFAYVTQRYGH